MSWHIAFRSRMCGGKENSDLIMVVISTTTIISQFMLTMMVEIRANHHVGILTFHRTFSIKQSVINDDELRHTQLWTEEPYRVV